MNMERVVIFRAWKDVGIGFWTVQFGKKEGFKVGESKNFTNISDAVRYAKGLRTPGSKICSLLVTLVRHLSNLQIVSPRIILTPYRLTLFCKK